ncbi:hypothetical protein CU669_15060 [Paramagnetospirillum kuznetsovii]|uniref:Large polyvalent protein-associated domain-containing protein n=1 Tax=Paramagnetospirillum kuznetsovii TaxID=2053833 RepID=A0A364NVG2_9PROT|nr:hypothetical protein [Paramagnetospirillum kuznetsovii]RAU21074.1 hypothetical protein CU669_15060 [Paramagnetospirillum kuznetsovii]
MAEQLQTADEFFGADPVPGPSGPHQDMVEPGNIDLAKRPRVQNSDGSISTVRSMSFNDGASEVLVPTVVDGRIVSNDDAVDHYRKTGEHLGKFSTVDGADQYASKLHEAQAAYYGKPTADEFFGPEPQTPIADSFVKTMAVPAMKLLQAKQNIADAITGGLKAGFGDDPIGLTDKSREEFRKAGMFKSEPTSWNNVLSNSLKTFNETLIGGVIAPPLDLGIRTAGAVIGGVQGGLYQTAKELGQEQLGRDLAGIVESEMGTSTAHGVPHVRDAAPVRARVEPMMGEPHAIDVILPKDVAEARANGVIGEGDAGYFGADPTPEDMAARRAAAADVAVHEGTPKPDVHSSVRQMEPELMGRWDDLHAQKESLRSQIESVPDQIDAQIEDMQARAKRVKPSAAAVWERRIAEMQASRDELIQQKQAELRKQLLDADYQMRDIGPQVRDAYARAEDWTGPLEEPTADPVKQAPPKQEAGQPGKMTLQTIPQQILMMAREHGYDMPASALQAAEREMLAEAGIHPTTLEDGSQVYITQHLVDEAARRYAAGEWKPGLKYDASHIDNWEKAKAENGQENGQKTAIPSTTEEHRQAIRDDIYQRLLDAGRSETFAGHEAELWKDYYTRRADARFEGRKGSAWDLYQQERPDVVGQRAPKATTREMEMAQKGTTLNQDKAPDSEIVAKATPDRKAGTFAEAREQAASFVGKLLTNIETGLVATVSNNNLGKMLSSKAAKKSVSEADHALAVANADKLFKVATLDDTHPDKNAEPTIKHIQRYVAPMIGSNGDVVAVKLTVKETTGPKEPNPIYSIEAVDVSGSGLLAPSGDGIERGIGVKDVATSAIAGPSEKMIRVAGEVKDAIKRLKQTTRGTVSLLDRGLHSLVTLMKDADASTFMHESAHIYLSDLMRDAADPAAAEWVKHDGNKVLEWLGAKDAESITRRQHEKFARGFERYLMEGVAPSHALARVFAEFKQWLTAIYDKVGKLKAPISEDIRDVFARFFNDTNERVVVAPEIEKKPGLADIHERDAETTPPHLADPVADHVKVERHADVAKVHPEESDAIPGGIAGETGSDAVRSPALDNPTDGPVALPGEAGQAEGMGEVGPGGTDAASGGTGSRDAAAGGNTASPGGRTEPPSSASEPFGRDDRLLDKAGNIRLDNLGTPEDVNQVIRQAAAENGDFTDARRGVITDADVISLSEALGMNAFELNKRKLGQAFNAEQIMAARKLLVQSATAVRDAMKAAAEGGDAELLKYAEIRARHLMIQEQVSGITAEAGRALRAFRAIEGMEDAKQIDILLKQSGVPDLKQLRQEAEFGAQLKTPAQVSRWVNSTRAASFKDMIVEYYINNLISGPVTHMGYAIHNGLLLVSKVGETALAGGIGAAREVISGKEIPDRVYAGEAIAQVFGLMHGGKEGLKAAWNGLLSNELQRLPGETLADADNINSQHALQNRQAITGANVSHLVHGMGEKIGQNWELSPTAQKVWDAVGGVVRAPGRPIQAVHALTRFMAYSQEVYSQAYRQAAAEGKSGYELSNRVAQIVNAPPVEMMKSASETATNMALMKTHEFGTFVNALSRLSNSSLPAKIVIPFVSIVSNVLREGLVERSVAGVLLDQEVRDNLMGRNGGAARDAQAGRIVVGSMISAIAVYEVLKDNVTGAGPDDPRERAMWIAAGHSPYSIRGGNHWISFRGGPIGTLLGITADIVEIAKHSDDKTLGEAAGAMVIGVAKAIKDESWLRGVADLMGAVDSPNRNAERYISQLAANFAVPFSVGAGQITHLIDPTMRDARGVVDTIKAKVPFLSKTLPSKYDMWGQPMEYSRFSHNNGKPDPIATEMERLGITMSKLKRDIRGVELTDQQYGDYQRLAGRLTRQVLEQTINAPGWNTVSDFARRETLSKIVTGTRQQAQAAIIAQSRGGSNDILAQAMKNKREAVGQ